MILFLVDKLQNIASPIKQLREYFNNTNKELEKVGQSEKNEKYHNDQRPILLSKYGSSNVNGRERNNDDLNNYRVSITSLFFIIPKILSFLNKIFIPII